MIRLMYKVVIILFFAVACPYSLSSASNGGLSEKNKLPNVVIILADDLGYGDITCNNPDARISTPNIDGLAKSGMRFTAAHATSSVCTPSRYSILTGRYNWRSRLKSGVLGAYSPPLIDSARMTIADVFKNKGYQTACIGKWHLGLEFTTSDRKEPRFNSKTGETNIEFKKPLTQSPNDLGFDYFYGVAASADMPPYMYIENRDFVSPYDTIKGDPKFTRTDMSKFFRAGRPRTISLLKVSFQILQKRQSLL